MNIFIAGASSGIGKAAATLLVSQGHTVAVMARRTEKLSSIPGAILCPGDITSAIDNTRCVEIALTGFTKRGQLPQIDRLYNFAGGAVFIDPATPLTEAMRADIQRVVEVNVMGSVRLLNSANAHLSPDAKVGICSSLIAHTDSPKVPTTEVYFWSKKLLESAMQKYKKEFAKRGISLTLIRPGTVNTEAFRPEGADTWKDASPLLKRAGQFGTSAEACARNCVHDVERGVEISFPTIDARLAREFPQLHEILLGIAARISEQHRKFGSLK